MLPKKLYIYASYTLISICFEKHPDLKIELISITPEDIMQATAMFTGFDFHLKNRKSLHLRFAVCRPLACSVKYHSDYRQPSVYCQTFWFQGTCVLNKISCPLRHCSFFYLKDSKKEGNDQINSPLQISMGSSHSGPHH